MLKASFILLSREMSLCKLQAYVFKPEKQISKAKVFQHQPGQLVGNDAIPTFEAKTLPPGTAPASKTFQPNPIDEVPGQANNPDASDTATGALDMPGATSGDVHTGLGHPGSGQTSAEIANDGKSNRARERQGLQGLSEGGSGMQGNESVEARQLQEEHEKGPLNAREHNASLEGVEEAQHVQAEQVASMGQEPRKVDYDRTFEDPPGKHS